MDVEDLSAYSPYMINKFLSMDMSLIDIVNVLNETNLAPAESYRVYFDFLPKKKYYLKWVGPKKDEKMENLITFIYEYYGMSRAECEALVEAVPPDEMRDFVKSFGYDDKQIKNKFGI